MQISHASAEPPQADAPRRRWLFRIAMPIVVMMIAHVIGLIALNGFIYYGEKSRRGLGSLEHPLTIIWFATPFSQASLLAFWTGVSRCSAARRFATPLLPLLGICLLSFVWGQLAFRRPGFLPSLAVLVQWLAMALLIDRLFRARGWRIRRKDDAAFAEQTPQLFQFGIKHLLVWTTLIAVALALGRVVLPLVNWDRGDLPGFALFGAFNCIYLIPLMALALRDRGWIVGVALSLAWMTLVTLAEREMFDRVYGGHEHSYLFGLNAVEATVIVGSLLAVRAAGWRLMR